MKRDEIREWIVASFEPVSLSIKSTTIDQVVELSIAYWNTHSAHKIVKMFTLAPNTAGNGAIQLDNEIKSVVHCYPSTMTESLFSDHPMWVLLGFISLDRYTQDLMLLSHTFEGYRIYLGDDFRFKFERAMDSETGGWLFYQKAPMGASKIAVVGTKRIIPSEDITNEFIYNWIRQYARAIVKMYEGAILRKATIIGIQNDGQDLVTEGKEEKKELEEQLRKEARWLMCAVRK